MADLSITAANVLQSSNSQKSNVTTAGVAITAGQVCYKYSDGTAHLASSTGASPANQPIGIAANNAAAGQPVTIVASDPAFTPGATIAAGVPYFLSANAGGICPFGDLATGDTGVFLFIGNSTTQANLAIVGGGVHA